MSSDKKEIKKSNEQNFTKQYSDIFSILGINPASIRHEWNKDGDSIKEYTLFEEHPNPILTTHTHPFNS